MHKDMKEILFTQEQISERCKELGAQISKDYEGKKILLIGLLKGSIPFLAELSKYIEGDVYFDYKSAVIKELNLELFILRKTLISMSKVWMY